MRHDESVLQYWFTNDTELFWKNIGTQSRIWYNDHQKVTWIDNVDELLWYWDGLIGSVVDVLYYLCFPHHPEIVVLHVITDQLVGCEAYVVMWLCCYGGWLMTYFLNYFIFCLTIKSIKTANWYLKSLVSQNGGVSIETNDY